MKYWFAALCLLLACTGAAAKTRVWQPSAGHVQVPIWPGTPPDARPMPGPESETLRTGHLVAGRPWMAVTDVSRPTMTVYPPKGRNTGTAVVVFPGGGFQVLAIDLEGTEICDWLTSKGITCVLLKYRVPSVPYDWHCDCRPHDLALSLPSLQDAQRTLRLVRFHAREWHIDPHKVGVIGFSAGGFLVAETSTQFKRRLYAPVDAADRESSRPDFAMAIYPGHLATDDDKLNPNVPVSRETPFTFLVQAEDDYVDGVNQSLVYYTALAKTRVPAELHLYAHGGHAFGLRRTRLPITGWPKLADAWMRTIGVLPRLRRRELNRGQARSVVLVFLKSQGYKIGATKFNLENDPRAPNLPEFYMFHAYYDTPSRLDSMGVYAVNRKTAALWERIGCEQAKSPALKQFQSELRKRIGLSEFDVESSIIKPCF